METSQRRQKRKGKDSFCSQTPLLTLLKYSLSLGRKIKRGDIKLSLSTLQKKKKKEKKITPLFVFFFGDNSRQPSTLLYRRGNTDYTTVWSFLFSITLSHQRRVTTLTPTTSNETLPSVTKAIVSIQQQTSPLLFLTTAPIKASADISPSHTPVTKCTTLRLPLNISL